MSNSRNSYNYNGKNLSDVFKELNEIKSRPSSQMTYDVPGNVETSFYSKKRQSRSIVKEKKLYYILIMCIIISVVLFLLVNRKAFASTTTLYEVNNSKLNIQEIITANADITRFKEQIVEEYDIDFETLYNENPTLPRGENITIQEGSIGKGHATIVRTFEADQLIDATVLSKQTVLDPIPLVIDVGTSDFLAKHQIHIGDTLYFTADSFLKTEPNSQSEDVIGIYKYIDVKLTELVNEQWCKVSVENYSGYVQTENLTSAFINPEMPEKCRIQRILLNVYEDMPLNTSTPLTLADYEKIFTNLPSDTNKIFQNNYEIFYKIDKNYNINGIFLASIAIHESAWGTSKIASDKFNLFGFGAYDETPYESSLTFTDYSNGIETVASALTKNYLNPAGTRIYNDDTASGIYYNGPTVSGVNIRYATDPEWHNKVYNYMEMLYNRLSN